MKRPARYPSPRLLLDPGMLLAVSALAATACGDGNGPAGTVGALRVSVSTSGAPLDPDGYIVLRVADTVVRSLGAGLNDTVDFREVAPGDQRVTLENVSPTCSVVEASPALVFVGTTIVTVTAGEMTTVHFAVDCAPPPPGRLAFVYSPDGFQHDVYLMNLDGTGLIPVTSGGGSWPAWSPDGTQLALTCGTPQGICVANADGSGLTQLTTTSGLFLKWSPDGSRIGYVCPQAMGICIINRDGSGLVRLSDTSLTQVFSWAPSGARLAFQISTSTSVHVFTVNPDGSMLAPLTADSFAADPAWSPSDDAIAFVNLDGVYRVRSDGTGRTQLTTRIRGDDSPVWSPDGSRIAFHRFVNKNTDGDIWIMNADGTDLHQVTLFTGTRPVWSPDGTHLVFEIDARNLYLIGADGSHLTALTGAIFPATATSAAWSP